MNKTPTDIRRDRHIVSQNMFTIGEYMKRAQKAINALDWFQERGQVSEHRPAKNVFEVTITASTAGWSGEDEALYYLRQATIQHQDDILALAKKMADTDYEMGKNITQNKALKL